MVEIELSHISMVLQCPSQFDYTREELDEIFKNHDERIGIEGQAREEIIKELVGRGWIRIRYYKNYWSVNVADMTNRTKDFLKNWASKAIRGEFGEMDRYVPAKVSGLHQEWTFSDLEEVECMEG